MTATRNKDSIRQEVLKQICRKAWEKYAENRQNIFSFSLYNVLVTANVKEASSELKKRMTIEVPEFEADGEQFNASRILSVR